MSSTEVKPLDVTCLAGLTSNVARDVLSTIDSLKGTRKVAQPDQEIPQTLPQKTQAMGSRIDKLQHSIAELEGYIKDERENRPPLQQKQLINSDNTVEGVCPRE